MRKARLLMLFVLALPGHASAQPKLVSIESAGVFVREANMPGETRKDDVVPRHAQCLQLSKDRWLVVISTHGFRGVDDERSIMYQVRKDGPEGATLKEGYLAKVIHDWRPARVPPAPEGRVYFKQIGHPVVFGTPRGAHWDGKPAVHGNHFVALWRVIGRPLDVQKQYLERVTPELFEKTQDVEWLQFRLNDAGDDIEVTQPARSLRPLNDPAIPGGGNMNQTFSPPVAVSERGDAWVVCNHFDKNNLAVLEFAFQPASKRYEWVKTGPFLDAGKRPLTEASTVRTKDEWLITARTNGQIAWFRTKDLFAKDLVPMFGKEPVISAPHTTFLCADGVVDSIEQKLAMRRVVRPRIDFAILFPPHGRTQLLVYSVTPRAFNFPYGDTGIPPATPEDKAASGLYFSRLVYDRDVPARWHFE